MGQMRLQFGVIIGIVVAGQALAQGQLLQGIRAPVPQWRRRSSRLSEFQQHAHHRDEERPRDSPVSTRPRGADTGPSRGGGAEPGSVVFS
jgi:hypothetical protein